MLGIVRRVYAGAGLGGGVFGIAGWEHDARTWLEWAAVNPVLAGALMGGGGAMVATWIVWEIVAFMQRRNSPRTTNGITIHGGLSIVNNYYSAADRKHHAVVEGRGEIVSSTPVEVRVGTLTMGPPTLSVSATKVRATPPAASDDERPQ